jgi:Uma2 family endonuclease
MRNLDSPRVRKLQCSDVCGWRRKEAAEYDAGQGNESMRMEATRKRFTVDEYYRMADAGILAPGDRVELIDGEIIQMSPIGTRHLGCVNATTEIFISVFKGRAVISGQNPVQLSDFTEPQPDIVLLKPRNDFYRGKHPEAADALLVVEVSETTLRYDRDLKLSYYAAAGVPEVWIEDLNGDRILVFRKPVDGIYQVRLVLGRDESISVEAFPDNAFTVSDFLG